MYRSYLPFMLMGLWALGWAVAVRAHEPLFTMSREAPGRGAFVWHLVVCEETEDETGLEPEHARSPSRDLTLKAGIPFRSRKRRFWQARIDAMYLAFNHARPRSALVDGSEVSGSKGGYVFLAPETLAWSNNRLVFRGGLQVPLVPVVDKGEAAALVRFVLEAGLRF